MVQSIISSFYLFLGPGSSDTSNVTSPEDGGTPLRAGDVAINLNEEEVEDEYAYGDEGRSVTPNNKTGTVGASSKAQDAHDGMNGNAPPVADVKLAQPLVGHANFEKATPTIQSKAESLYGQYHSGYFSVNSPVSHKDTRQWAVRRQESDLSTAPFSSETLDMDTYGNERMATTDSMVDVNSDVHVAPSPPLNRAQGDRKGVPLGKVKGVGMVHVRSIREAVEMMLLPGAGIQRSLLQEKVSRRSLSLLLLPLLRGHR